MSGTMTVLTYDSLNRVVTRGDPDDSSVPSPYCSKTPRLAGSMIATRTTSYSDGSPCAAQTPAEAAASVSTQFQYDFDGNATSEQRHIYTLTARAHEEMVRWR